MQTSVCVRKRVCAAFFQLTIIGPLLSAGLVRAQTPAPHVKVEPLPGARIQITVTGEAQRFHRIDGSTNLTSWRPLVVLTNTTGTMSYDDTNAPALPMRFYRAADVAAAAGVSSLGARRGSAGAQIEIFGQFFDGHPGDNMVRIGDLMARVIEADGTRLLIEVPTNASTGPLTITTPSGETSVRQFFVVTAPALGTFDPPPSVNAAQYELVNPYGVAMPLAPGNPTNQFLVRRGRPIVNMAVPTNRADQTYFLAITISDGAPFVIDAASTAQALVFMNPFLQTRDVEVAAPLLAIIAANAKVQLLASNIAAIYPLGGDPFANASFVEAYADAVASVINSSASKALAAKRAKAASQSAPGDVDLDFIVLNRKGSDVFVKGRALNPVDWGLTLWRLKTDAAFPKGERDYRRALLFDKGLTNYPVESSIVQRFDIEADLALERFDVIDAAIDELQELVAPKNGEKLKLENDDSIYLLRAIGPAWNPVNEFDFVQQHFEDEYVRIVAINLLNAVLDLLSVMVDAEELGGQLAVEIADAALREAAGIQSTEDFLAAAAELAEEVAKELSKKGAEVAAEKVAGKALMEKIAGSVGGVFLKVLEIISAPGQIIERVTGLARTTTMETSFIVTGNPFKLDILSITPPGGAVGEPLEIVIRGAQLDPGDEYDHVVFSTYQFPGKILSVANLGNNQQKITVQIPDQLKTNDDGALPLQVIAQGRRGSTNFMLVRAPVVTLMEPVSGFAAVAKYLGSPFPGTTVRLTGYGFAPSNTFLFGGVEATAKSGFYGDVTVNVPAGAPSGPITVRRVDIDGQVREGMSAPFEVFGPPSISSYAPNAGFVGSGVRVTAVNLGAGPATLEFNGGEMGQGSFAGTRLAAVIPTGAAIGAGELRVRTPAGLSAPATFTVAEGPAPGGFVQVGGPFTDKSPPIMSPITLARAAIIVGATNAILGAPACSSGDFCVDDQDVLRDTNGMIIAHLDPPIAGTYEEGDFMTDNGVDATPRFPIGAAYADYVGIIGSVAGDVTFTGSHDTIFPADGPSATINGPLTIAGSHNYIAGLIIKGTLTILGDNNEVNVIVSEASGPGVVIRGSHNSVNVTTTNNSGDGLVIDGGNFNDVHALAMGNGGNGFTITGGASGNAVGAGTALPGIPPGSGNAGHGVALLGDVNGNVILGTGLPIGGNGSDGVHVSGAVRDTKMHTIIAQDNGGHGIFVGSGASRTLIAPALLTHNSQNGIYLDGCSATELYGIQTGFNSGHGILVSGVDDPHTAIEFAAQANTGSALRLVSGTSRIRVTGMNSAGSVGLELNGAGVTQNVIDMTINDCTADGARVMSAERNELTLAIRGSGGHGLLVSGGAQNSVTLIASNNALDGARFTDNARANMLAAIVVSNRTGVVLANGARENLVQDLRANANREHGLLLTGIGTRNNRVLDAHVGLPILTNEPPGNALDGIRIDAGASGNTLGSDAGHGPEVRNNGVAGIRIAGVGTTNNVILGALVTLGDPAHVQAAGIVVEDGAADTIIGGFTAAERCTNSFNLVGIHLRSGATRTVVQNCRVEANGGAGLLIENAPDNLIGSTRASVTNDFLNNFGSGVELTGAGTMNCQIFGNNISGNNDGVFIRGGASANHLETENNIHNNTTGVRVDGASHISISQNLIHDNTGNGVVCTGGATDNHITANMITRNAIGVVVDGSATVRNEIVGNIITANAGKGIALLGLANGSIEAPIITSLTSQSVMGTNSTPDGSVIELFRDLDDEGEKALGSGTVHGGRFSVALNESIKIPDVGVLYNLHATVTDPNGNTSEFGDYIAGGNADGGVHIAFTSTRDGNAEIYLTDASSLPATRLTTDPADDNSPALSTNGYLAFVSTRTGNAEIFTLPLSNLASIVQLTTNAAPDYDPAWSPNGSNLVFVSELDGNAEIYRMNADGSGLARLTFDSGMDRWPSFSPDGTKIVFTSTRNGNFDLFIMNADGSGAAPLAAHSAADTRPAWSPDGELIAFVSDRDGNLELYTVKPDGTELTRLTIDLAVDSEPSWFPNGQTLVFSSNRDEGHELYTMPRAGGPTVRLTVSTGDNLHPSAARR